ncbi:MAG TPA: hypothetical protein VGG71_04240 [Chitinophagaceae bacterium]
MLKTINFFRNFSVAIGLFSIAGIIGCNKEPAYTPTSDSSTVIDDFWLEKTTSNATLNRAYEGMIMGDTAIHLTVDYGTDITALEPTIFSYADSIFPKGKQNFSNPVKYTLWAKGKSASYIVRIVISPVQFPQIKTIAAGYSHIMALKTDGTLWVCGNNASGQLGLGDYSSRNKFTQVPIYDVAQIFSGDAASIIKLKDGTAWGTGNQYGQLGLGNINDVVTFTRTPFFDDVVQVSITFNEVFVLKADGTVWGAGQNRDSILLQGDHDLRANFVKVPISNVKQLSVSAYDVIALKNNGELWGWGENLAGELGLGDKAWHMTPMLLPTSGASIAKIFSGGSTTFFLDNNGKVWAAGANLRGQLGLGDLNNRTSFIQLPFFNTKSIDVIIPHSSCVSFKETNGNVWNAGDNVIGEMGLGNISTLPYTTPVQLPGFTATQVSGTGGTMFSTRSDNTLWAWGSNSSGALGMGVDTAYISSPIQLK